MWLPLPFVRAARPYIGHVDLPLAAEEAVLTKLAQWAAARGDVRAVLLIGSRAAEGSVADVLSDFDIIITVTDVETLTNDSSWQLEMGRPLVGWGDEDVVEGFRTVFRGVVYDDGTKVDYWLWPVPLLRHISTLTPLPDELDAGYRVLLDKDGTAAKWPAPTYRAYVPTKPTRAEYRALVEEFWWDTTYAAKSLWRGELVFAKSYMFEHEIRLEVLQLMLEWWIGVQTNWSVPTGRFGRGLRQLLPPEVWADIEATYVGSDVDENWDALLRLIALFRQLAVGVADALGFDYPGYIDERVTAYVESVRAMPSS